METFDLDLLRTLVTIADCETFGAAAVKLDRTSRRSRSRCSGWRSNSA